LLVGHPEHQNERGERHRQRLPLPETPQAALRALPGILHPPRPPRRSPWLITLYENSMFIQRNKLSLIFRILRKTAIGRERQKMHDAFSFKSKSMLTS
jgi:hypothetical protein